MKPKAAKDFNTKSKVHVYVVGIGSAQAPLSGLGAETAQMMGKVSRLAKEEGLENDVQALSGGEQLDLMGVFLLKAPQRFANRIAQMEGIAYVEKPTAKRKKRAPATKKPSPNL